jgi:hypothetical protein
MNVYRVTLAGEGDDAAAGPVYVVAESSWDALLVLFSRQPEARVLGLEQVNEMGSPVLVGK